MDDSCGMSVDKNIRLAEEKLFDSIFKEARLEGVPVAYWQVEAICREMPVAGLPAEYYFFLYIFIRLTHERI